MTKEELRERVADIYCNWCEGGCVEIPEIKTECIAASRIADSIISIFKELVESVENPNFTQSMFSGSKHSGFEQFRQSLLSILGE